MPGVTIDTNPQQWMCKRSLCWSSGKFLVLIVPVVLLMGDTSAVVHYKRQQQPTRGRRPSPPSHQNKDRIGQTTSRIIILSFSFMKNYLSSQYGTPAEIQKEQENNDFSLVLCCNKSHYSSNLFVVVVVDMNVRLSAWSWSSLSSWMHGRMTALDCLSIRILYVTSSYLLVKVLDCAGMVHAIAIEKTEK
eukprot:gene9994-6976_t